MDRIRQHETQITVCGLVCNVEVTYEVHDWGSLSRAPEVSCSTVVDLDTGHDWTRYCVETRPVLLVQDFPNYHRAEMGTMRAAILGHGSTARFPGRASFTYVPTELEVMGPTVMDTLHNEVCDAVDEIARQDDVGGPY